MDLTAPGSGAGSLPLLLALGLVILHCVVADGNSTRSPENDGLLCGDAREDCAATTTQSKWNDYFSPCPKKYEHYCINGKCRFVGALQTPSCLCDDGYAGARCERVDFFLPERRHRTDSGDLFDSSYGDIDHFGDWCLHMLSSPSKEKERRDAKSW